MKKLSLAFVSVLLLSFSAVAKDKPKDSSKGLTQKTSQPETQANAASAAETVQPAAKTEPQLKAQPASTEMFEGVQLAALSKVGGADLKAVSHGIRRKKVFGLVSVDIYVAEFYALAPEKIQKTDDQILNSLPAAGPVQIKLTLLRDLSGSDISKSFKEALKENDVDLSNPVTGLSDLMTEVETIKSFKKGEVFSLSADWSSNFIVVQKPDLTLKNISADGENLKKLFSIWLGKPVDEKMNDLKKSLLK